MSNRKVDVYLLIPVIFLLLTGSIMVLSSSYVTSLEMTKNLDPFYFFKRQILWEILGLLALYFGYIVPYKFYQQKTRLLMMIIIGILILVLIPGVGKITNGARSWFILGQPSEMVKLLLVFVLAGVMNNKIDKIDSFEEGVLPPVLLIGVTCVLVFLEPDLGTAIAIALTGLIMLFAAGAKLRYFVMTVVSAIIMAAIAVLFASYRMKRVLIFLDPWKDQQGDGYQTVQSLYALGSGGLSGLGLGQGRQKFLYIPEQFTDFIFSIIGEELGFIGGAFVLVLFIIIAARGYKIAKHAPDTFASLVAVGITSMILVEVLINVGVVTDTLPVTGVTLPFLSFGGSSLIFKLAGVGVLMNISGNIRWPDVDE